MMTLTTPTTSTVTSNTPATSSSITSTPTTATTTFHSHIPTLGKNKKIYHILTN